jgi:tRNA(Arg) A34 adenosine deaminase TadA
MNDTDFMHMALAKAREGIGEGQLPFGAIIVRGGAAISAAHNTVFADGVIIAHAETNAIGDACRRTGTLDLAGCTLYATCEPCPMCFGAAVLANIARIVFSARIGDVIIPGFSMLSINNNDLKRMGDTGIQINGDLMRDEGINLFQLWDNHQ